jgi:hypothetical protein
MPRSQRLAVYLIIGALWVSGCAWLCLDQFFEQREQFGRTPHPLEAPILLAHGVIGIFAMYLLGWISARHVLRWWPGGLRRVSGGTLAGFLALLAASGFALFFISNDEWQHMTALSHDVLGVGVTVLAIWHWLFLRRGGRA